MAPNMMSHPIFKKKGPTKKGFLRKLVVSDGGLAISTKLEEHGAVFTAKAVVTPVITFNDQSKVTGSRIVVRGPLFHCPKVKAQSIWPEARAGVEVAFTVGGQALKFSPGAPNVSEWLELRSLQSYSVTDTEAMEELDQEQVDEEDGVRKGACVRVVLRHVSPIVVGAFLQVTYSSKPQA